MDKTLKYITYDSKKFTILTKLYLLPEMQERLTNIPGRPLISNCKKRTKKSSYFLYYYMKRVVQNRASYIKGSNDFIGKVKSIDISADALHEVALKALRNALEKINYKETQFDNYFEFDCSFFNKFWVLPD